jgi:hypothetical protein
MGVAMTAGDHPLVAVPEVQPFGRKRKGGSDVDLERPEDEVDTDAFPGLFGC